MTGRRKHREPSSEACDVLPSILGSESARAKEMGHHVPPFCFCFVLFFRGQLRSSPSSSPGSDTPERLSHIFRLDYLPRVNIFANIIHEKANRFLTRCFAGKGSTKTLWDHLNLKGKLWGNFWEDANITAD
ncbi:unnamed protein product [Durusdinium trenchii]|uniref:Uncharacterized protein n=1 Tax=Durusdinium trenchii TaxID=1381693 RepID=A0ABP0LYS9_9DINO